MVALNFNATQVAPNAALEAIPSGTYDVMITASTQKPTKDGSGKYIELEMTVQGDQYNGRKVFDRLNTENKSAQAVEIAYGTLSAICHVCNRHQIADTQQLHNIPFKAVVAKVGRTDANSGATLEGQYSNDVKGYKDVHGNDPGKSGAGGAPQGGQGGPAPSWANQGQPGNNPMAPMPNYGQPQPHQGPGGQLYPDPAHAPQGQPQPQGQPPQWAGQPQGQPAAQQPPQWAGQPQQQVAPQPQYAPAPQQQPDASQQQQPQGQPQQAGAAPFNPGAAPPWVTGQQQPQG